MRRITAAALVLLLLVPVLARASADLETRILSPSVTIKAGHAQGSGVIFTRGKRCFVLTAAHVIEPLREVKSRLDSKQGRELKYEHFRDAQVLVMLYESNRKVGKSEMDARIIAYSDARNGEDLALLEIRKQAFIKGTATFLLDAPPTRIGVQIYHCGSLQGELGSNSLTDGIVSRVGRVYEGKVYDQTSANALPGSSGGGVFLGNGTYIGMITRGSRTSSAFNLYVPARRIQAWLKKIDHLWVIDPRQPVPKEK